MSSPRKYASPYLSGLPGLPVSTSSAVTGTVKTKKKSKTSLVKLSESAQVVKQIQDGIWQSAAKSSSSKTSTVATASAGVGDFQGNSSPFPRKKESNNNFNDASCGDFPDFQKLGINEEEIRGNELEVEREDKKNEEDMPKWEEPEYKSPGQEGAGAGALVTCKDSIVLKQGSGLVSSRSTTDVYHEDWGILQEEDNEDDNDNEELEFQEGVRQVHLRSILKKPSVYYTKPAKFELSKKSGGKTLSKGKFGRPNKEVKEGQGTGSAVAGKGNKLKNAQGSISNLEMHSKLMGNKGVQKSPRKKSKVNTKAGVVEENKEQMGGGAKKAVRFSTRVDVHSVPYEPRAGSRACDWQRNMLEQRVQTFRQLMREVGGTEEMDLFGNSMLFPGYPSYHVPNPNFALRGSSLGPPGSSAGPPGIIGLAGMGRGRNTNYKL